MRLNSGKPVSKIWPMIPPHMPKDGATRSGFFNKRQSSRGFNRVSSRGSMQPSVEKNENVLDVPIVKSDYN